MAAQIAPYRSQTFFAPQLLIPGGITDISFYRRAFNAVELRMFKNDDGSIHVAELSINDCIFHLHEERPFKGQLAPTRSNGITTIVGLFVENVDETIANALAAGAHLLSEAQDYDYGYRQALIEDPFRHQWMIESKI